MGKVGKRTKVKEGCGYYQATVPVMLPSLLSNSTQINLHWVSDQAGNPNRLSDTDANLKLFGAKGSKEELEKLFADLVHPDRIVYISTFLDHLGES
ncbi:MAG: hypothetical protein SGARI_000973 [Bacillariaceae sp.]